jgi:hypothetical protein
VSVKAHEVTKSAEEKLETTEKIGKHFFVLISR